MPDNVVQLVPRSAGRSPGSGVPKGLSRAARAEWNRLAPVLRERGALPPELEPLLAAYVGAMALIAECDRAMAKQGVTIIGANGIPRPHPLFGARNKASQNALQLAKRLGIIGSGAPTAPPKEGEGADPYSDLGI